METLKIYLAGGMNSDWQSKVINRFDNNFIYLNPQNHNLSNSKEYTVWDLFFVQKCDILFGFMENTNPSGFGLTLEVGFAKALNKTIILVDEKSASDSFFKEKFRIVRESASIVFDSLEDGQNYLDSFLRIKK